jgi:hypothetical protein
MRRGTIIFVIAAIQLLLIGAAASAATAAPSARPKAPSTRPGQVVSAANAVPGRMVSAPRQGALVRRLPARVVVRVPHGTSRLLVEAGGRDVTARFRRSGASARVAELSTRDGLHYGTNRLFVLAQRHGRSPVSQTISFVVARRDDGIARLRVRPGPVTSVRARTLGAPDAERTVSLSLNGHRVTQDANHAHPLLWTAELSPSQGLRHGRNRVTFRVLEPGSGRYAVLTQSFVVPQSMSLAAAGRDIATSVGQRVYLDGNGSLASPGADLRYDWGIVSQPAASSIQIRNAGSARAYFVPRHPGRYLIKLAVARRSVAFTASAGRQAGDTVLVTVRPSSLLVPIKGLVQGQNGAGIQVGGMFYPNPSPGGKQLQWLTLDRATLAPVEGPDAKPMNNWLDGSAGGPHGLDALGAALENQGLDDLVVLSYPDTGSGSPIQSGEVDQFNKLIGELGVDPIDKGILTSHGKLAMLGIPDAGEGSGWSVHGGGTGPSLSGWLMPDASTGTSGAPLYRFQPARDEFDTSAKSTPTSNTMVVDGHSYDATLPAGATGGFQIVTFDPTDLSNVYSAVYQTNGSSAPADDLGLRGMLQRSLNEPDKLVVMQSIGHVGPVNDITLRGYWNDVATKLAGFGANPSTFNEVNGSYAFVGASALQRGEVAQSSSAAGAASTNEMPQPGTLKGVLRMRSDGYLMPLVTDPSRPLDESLYDVALRPGSPWPYSEAAGSKDFVAYDKALAYITDHLQDLKAYYPNLRQAYAGNDNLVYSTSIGDLRAMPYPGDGQKCADQVGNSTGDDPGFTREQFCNLSAELIDEFHWLDSTKTLFDSYEKAIVRSGSTDRVNLETIGEDIRKAVEPSENGEIVTGVLNFVESIANVASLGTVGEVAGVLGSAYELGSAIASSSNGAPVGDQITAKVSTLATAVANNVVDAQNGLDRIRDVIISNYGRLKALGPDANGPKWSIDVASMTTRLTIAANGYFSSELFPLAYRADYLSPGTFNSNPTVDNCYIYFLGHSFVRAPKTAWVAWDARFEGANNGTYPYFPNLLAFANRRGWSASDYAYPPPDLTNHMFGPINKADYGLYLPDYIWTNWKAPYNQVTCH